MPFAMLCEAPAEAQAPVSRQGIPSTEYETSDDGAKLLARILATRPLASIEQAASQGDGEALYLLGIAKLRGIGTAADPIEARRLLRRAVLAGFHRATLAYGNMLFNGLGGEKDVEEALSWWQSGAEAGSPAAMLALGDYYRFNAPEAARDLARAKTYYQQAAARNHPAAGTALADYVRLGLDQPADPAAALALYEQAARSGSAVAYLRIAFAYRFGQGYARDPAKAIDAYRQAALLGDGEGLYQAARMLIDGDGVPADPAAAGALLAATATASDWRNQGLLAKLILLRAIRPIPGRDAEAIALEADARGHPEALGALTNNLREGRNGFARNLRRAGELARASLARFRSRAPNEPGAWPIYAKAAAYTIQTAIAAGEIEPQPGEKDALEKTYGSLSSKLIWMDVPIRCDGQSMPFRIYLWDVSGLTTPADAQFDWIEKSQGCQVELEDRLMYRRLLLRAHATKRSYPDIVVQHYQSGNRRPLPPIEF